MNTEGNPVLKEESAKLFIDLCTKKFGWRDLSKDVVMDVGCGVEGFCGKAVLDKFPDVGTVVGIDNNPVCIRDFRPRASTKMGCVFADIENSETLRDFKGRMTKVLATHVFQQLRKKEEAFRNVFDLLKPDGEAAVLFIVWALVDDWLKEMLDIPKWKEAYKGPYSEPSLKKRAAEYEEMVEKMGYRVIHCEEKEELMLYAYPDRAIETLFTLCGRDFNIPSGLTREFKEEGVNLLLKLSAKDAEGRLYYRQTELSLLLKKPA